MTCLSPAACAAVWLHTGGWFHTGDQGFLDEQGYVTLTGRIKELINRGGEKVSPLEVRCAAPPLRLLACHRGWACRDRALRVVWALLQALIRCVALGVVRCVWGGNACSGCRLRRVRGIWRHSLFFIYHGRWA